MRLLLAMLVLLCAGPVLANPLDDRAELGCEIVLAGGSTLECVLDFRYANVMASWTEFSGGLDGNGDGLVTRDELKARYNKLADQLIAAVRLEVDGAAVVLKPDFARFQFDNLDAPDTTPDLAQGAATDTFRIHYRFVFVSEPIASGAHNGKFHFIAPEKALRAPEQQMTVWDARVTPRVPLPDVSYGNALGSLPELTFNWTVKASEQPKPDPSAGGKPPQPAREPDPDDGESNAPAWLTLIAGCVLAGIGVLAVVRVLLSNAESDARKKALLTAGLLMLGGGVIILGALARLGMIAT